MSKANSFPHFSLKSCYFSVVHCILSTSSEKRDKEPLCVCLKSLFLPLTDPLCTCLWRNCAVEPWPCLLLVKFWNPSFHFKQKKKGGRMNKKKRREQHARKDLEQTGRSRREPLMRLDVAKAAHLFSLSRRDPWNRIRRVCVKGQHWHTAGSSPPCVRGAPPPPLSRIIFCFRREKKKRRRLIGPFIRGEGSLLHSLPAPTAARRCAFCGMAAGKRT